MIADGTDNTDTNNNKLTWEHIQKMFPNPNGKSLSDKDIIDLIKSIIVTAPQFISSLLGDWETQEIDGCLFLVAPKTIKKYKITVDSNFYHGEMSPETFGAALTLWIFNHRLWKFSADGYYVGHLSDRYYSMVSAACSSSLDTAAIVAFLD